MDINEVTLLGRVGKDPELKWTNSGAAVCTFSLATERKWKGQDNQEHKDTQWHRIVAWGGLAELGAEQFKKGTTVFVRGQLNTRNYDKNGTKVYVTEIRALTAYAVVIAPKGERTIDRSTGQLPAHDDEEDIPF